MSVSNGQGVKAEVFNPAFISKNSDDSTVFKLGLMDPDSVTSGPPIPNVQKKINDTADIANEVDGAVTAVESALAAHIADEDMHGGVSGDEFDPETGHKHDGTDSAKIEGADLKSTGATVGTFLKAAVGGGTVWDTATGVLVKEVLTATATIANSTNIALCDTHLGAFTVTTPSAADFADRTLQVVKTDSSSNILTVSAGGTNYKCSTQYETLTFYSDGSTIMLISRQYSKSPASYTPSSYQGIGTPTNVDLKEYRDGKFNCISGKLTFGTASGSEIRIALPNSRTIDSSIAPTVRYLGDAVFGSTGAGKPVIVGTGGNSYINVAIQASAFAGLTPVLGTSIGSSVTLAFECRVPITNWEG